MKRKRSNNKLEIIRLRTQFPELGERLSLLHPLYDWDMAMARIGARRPLDNENHSEYVKYRGRDMSREHITAA